MIEFLQEIAPTVIIGFAGILAIAGSYVARAVGKYLKEKDIIEKIKQKPYIADNIVRAMKDAYDNNQGELKRENGIRFLVEFMNDLGVEQTYEDADIFIRGAYERMKSSFEEAAGISTETMPSDDIETEVIEITPDDVTDQVKYENKQDK